jgi:hypothetical protein
MKMGSGILSFVQTRVLKRSPVEEVIMVDCGISGRTAAISTAEREQ